MRKTVGERLQNLSENGGECRMWIGAKDKDGYGRMHTTSGLKRAHRIAWEEENGPIPPGVLVLHSCDNRACIDPDHLFLGNVKDNCQDMVKKGRGYQQNKTHCPHGHEYTPENTRRTSDGSRYCGICKKANAAKRVR